MSRVFRPLVNFLLGLGYMFGLIWVWAGLEALTIERGEVILGILNISCGVILWVLLNGAGRLWVRLSFLQKEREQEL
jgi:hypothetical protein